MALKSLLNLSEIRGRRKVITDALRGRYSQHPAKQIEPFFMVIPTAAFDGRAGSCSKHSLEWGLSLIHISEPTRPY